MDITACVYRVSFETEIDKPMILGHTVYEKEISMTLSAGTVANLNPELVLKHMPIDEDNTYTVCREKIFCGEREFR